MYDKIDKKQVSTLLLIGLLAILAISMISTVSAADKTITNTTSGGLKTAIDDVGVGQTVYMENGIYTGSNNNEISINKSLTISGKGNNVVIDAKRTTFIFRIEKGNTVTLKNLKLINGKSTWGGAIYNSGNLVISGSTFSNNEATTTPIVISSLVTTTADGRGGAIFNSGNLSISGSTFSNNQASDGGAIYNSANLTVSVCNFNDNKADICGGAICIYLRSFASLTNTTSTTTVIKSTFTNNQAKLGGAIYIMGGGTTNVTSSNGIKYTVNHIATLVISNSTFNNNKASKNGGAIYINNYANVKISNSKFDKNLQGNVYNDIYRAGGTVVKSGLTITPNDGIIVDGDSTGSSGSTSSKKADLKIAKITKKGNYRYVTVKNVGKKVAGKNKLAIYVGKKKIKTVNVASIRAGKSVKIKVAIPKKYKSKLKTFKVDVSNVVKESNEKNNSLKAK